MQSGEQFEPRYNDRYANTSGALNKRYILPNGRCRTAEAFLSRVSLCLARPSVSLIRILIARRGSQSLGIKRFEYVREYARGRKFQDAIRASNYT